MSFSVDDLVSSLSESHIGQEANDIAILQAQLTQSLFGGPSSTSRGGSSRGFRNTQPCNTPMARTRASSLVGWNGPTSRRLAESHLDNDMEEDERMVEDLLLPSSPVLPSSNSYYKPSPSHFSMPSSPVLPSFQNSHTFPSNHSTLSTSTASSSQSHSDPSSVFTSTDPFYIAQLQASQSFNNPPQSVFSQNGHMSQGSPFATAQYHHHHHKHHQYQNWDNQPRSAMTCAAAF